MNPDRTLGVWAQVASQSQGTPVTLAHVCAAAMAVVGVNGAGVTVMAGPTVREIVYASDRVAADLEELQLTLGEGPCVDTFSDGGPALASDLRAPEYLRRWPGFTRGAIESGARAVFALPLQVGAIRLGALDLYRRRAGRLTPEELDDALAYAETAGMLLLDAAGSTAPHTDELAWNQQDTTAGQSVVHQATGMMLVQLGSSAAAAFARLRAYAYAHNRPLGDVARDVVERRLRFDPDPPHEAAESAANPAPPPPVG